jgi:hypothetical protein
VAQPPCMVSIDWLCLYGIYERFCNAFFKTRLSSGLPTAVQFIPVRFAAVRLCVCASVRLCVHSCMRMLCVLVPTPWTGGREAERANMVRMAVLVKQGVYDAGCW